MQTKHLFFVLVHISTNCEVSDVNLVSALQKKSLLLTVSKRCFFVDLFVLCFMFILFSCLFIMGAQWISGRVLDSRPRGRGFEPHRRHCVVVLEQDIFILA